MLKKYLIRVFVVLVCTPPIGHAGSADTVMIAGRLSDIKAKAIVVLPDPYLRSKVNFPVVYLLHGWSGSYRNWYDKTDLEQLADKYATIIVCPDGGYAGWYFDSPVKAVAGYGTYIGQEVVEYIDRHYRTLPKAGGRALCGLSMGGHGAFYLLAKYPHSFSMAGSMSGVMELNSYAQRYGVTELLGAFDTNQKIWADYSCVALVDSLVDKNKFILIDCGINDPFLESNRKLHHLLVSAGVTHDYTERFGGHNWDYWRNALEYHLLFFTKNGLNSE